MVHNMSRLAPWGPLENELVSIAGMENAIPWLFSSIVDDLCPGLVLVSSK